MLTPLRCSALCQLRLLDQLGELRERVAGNVGQFGDRLLTPDDVSRPRNTVKVQHETLRPQAAAEGRLVLPEIEICGYRVVASTFAVIAIYAMHRDPEGGPVDLRTDPHRTGFTVPR